MLLCLAVRLPSRSEYDELQIWQHMFELHHAWSFFVVRPSQMSIFTTCWLLPKGPTKLSAVCADIIKGVMPTLALVIILAIMPMIIKMMAEKIEKQPTKSAVDFSLGTKYYCFQFFIIFFFNTIIGAASSGKASGDDMPMVALFNELKDDPGKITGWLADAIPQQASSSPLLT